MAWVDVDAIGREGYKAWRDARQPTSCRRLTQMHRYGGVCRRASVGAG